MRHWLEMSSKKIAHKSLNSVRILEDHVPGNKEIFRIFCGCDTKINPSNLVQQSCKKMKIEVYKNHAIKKSQPH